LKAIFLWKANPTKWIEYNPISITYVDDKYIPFLRESVMKTMGQYKFDFLYGLVTDASFHFCCYIDKVENGIYTLKPFVTLKKSTVIETKFCSTEQEYLNECNKYDEKVVLDDYIKTEYKTNDPSVGWFLYPKGVMDIILEEEHVS
jgi:hypothetical protein